MYELNKHNRGASPTAVHEGDGCGCGPCQPRRLGILARPSVFSVLMALILIVELAAISGYIGAITSTLEKEFLLSSSEVGAISIINDVVSLALVGIFTYFGHTSHRPRLIGFGVVLVGVGTALCALPHFVTDPYSRSTELDASSHELCWETTNETKSDADNTEKQSKLGGLYLFIIGQIVVGVGNAPIIPLAMTYVDDAVEKYKTTAYVAVIYIGTSVGPIIGFLVGSRTLSLYVDLDVIPADQWPSVPQNDPRWIGAWWLGFLVFGSAMVLLALPLLLFPRRLRAPEDDFKKSLDVAGLRFNGVELHGVRECVTKRGLVGRSDSQQAMTTADEMEASNDDDKTIKRASNEGEGTVMKQVKDFMSALLRLCRNLTLVALALGMSTELAIVSGLTTFGAKYMETQFGISAGQAAFLTGIAIMPASCAGHILAGLILRRFRLSAFQCSVFLCVTVFVTLCIYPALIVLGCDTPAVVSPKTSSCINQCICNVTTIDPVCGIDDVTYVSPCLAGCTRNDERNKTFFDCSCVQRDNLTGTIANSSVGYDGEAWDAKESSCPVVCSLMVAYLVASSMSLFFMFMGQNPTMIINLRFDSDNNSTTVHGIKSSGLNSSTKL